MNAPTSPTLPPDVVTAWPRSAQLATAFLLGVCLTLIGVQAGGALRWGTRPTELEHGTGPAYRVDLNRAERPDLLQLPGVGPSLAERIEDHRRERGPFRSVDDLAAVRGVGPALLARLRPLLYVRSEQAADRTERPAPGKRSPSDPKSGAAPRAGGRKETNLAAPIDVNRATAEELQRLPGVGPKMAQRIVDERQKGRFKTVDDLRRVTGIGAKTLEKLRPHVTVGNDTEPGPAAG
jgi:competence protein ComEA